MQLNVTPMDATGKEEQLPPDITCDALWTMEERGDLPTLVDVRKKDEWDTGHIDYAIHLPLDEIEDTADAILPNKSDLIVACCSLGGRSAKAAEKLRQMGYTNVHNLSGGYTGYCARDEAVKADEE